MILRLFIAIILFIVIAGFVTYFLIPSPIVMADRVSLNTSANGAYRVLTKQDVWNKFSPGTFRLHKQLVNTIEIDVNIKDYRVPVSILLIPLAKDSVILSWNTNFPVVNNPVSKIRQYSRAMATRDKLHETFQKFQNFVEDNENVYGIHINETSTQDTFLIATRFTSNTFPSNQLVYSYINKLQSYAASVGVAQTSPPMLNISKSDSIHFNNMVAIPINNKAPDSDSIFFVRMVPGRFLATEVKGGPYTIQHAHTMMAQYFRDFNRLSMAIPFEYLITDRIQEPDTTKWVTRIYGPVY